jgi:Na+-transporting NADH:ubiquinone oxidoreductase subunit B
MFLKQLMMRKVLYALAPIYLFSLWLYGIQLLLLTLVVFPTGILIEYYFEKRRNIKVSEAVLVTCALFTLSLPPRTPLWIAFIGIVFSVLFAKMAFGGFGRNPFNPAISGRLFIYLSFPASMTYGWNVPGNFGINADVLTGATPLDVLRAGGEIDFISHISGLRAGSIGEGMVILIVLAGIYLIWTKTASYEIILSTLASFIIVTFGLEIAGIEKALPTVGSLISGSILFVVVFIATDPISAPKKTQSKWIYGLIIGSSTVLVRTFSLFPEGTSFGIMLGNTFASLLDELFTPKKKGGKK